MKPYITELKPLSMFSLPSDGPTVRSSTISIGAASAPARISSAMSLASRVVIRPLICTRPPPISSRITGAVMTSALPFSTSTIAIRLPTFSRVTSLKMRAPVPSRLTCTAGSLLRWSKPGCASLMRSPVSTTCRLTSTGLAAALGEEVAAEGHLAGQRLLERAGVLVDHADFERRGAAEDVLGARGVLHAGQLHDDAVGALLLDDRLGDAELVDAVAQDRDVLLDRAVLDALLRLGLQRRDRAAGRRRAPSASRSARSGKPSRSRRAPSCARPRRGSG